MEYAVFYHSMTGD